MKIAVPTNDGKKIASHFRRSSQYKIFDIENNRILKTEIRPTGFMDPYRKHPPNKSLPAHHEIQKEIISVIEDCDRVMVNRIRKRHISMLVAQHTIVDITREEDINKAIEYYFEISADD
jgi:predicted Fe-Mo cluster-binding NifX family protein